MLPKSKFNQPLENLAYACAKWTGNSWTFLLTISLTLAWLISGPFFNFSSNWQAVMGMVSSVTSFTMVFLLQRSQNKDSLAMQIKLNEIIASLNGADNRLISIENSSEGVIRSLQKDYEEVASHVHQRDDIANEAIITGEILKAIIHDDPAA